MRIHEICSKTGLSKRTIHYYIKEQLITPEVNKENGYYNFSEEDCRCLNLVHELRNADLPIPIIRSLIHNPAASGYYLRLHAQKLQKEIKRLDKIQNSLNFMIDSLPINPDLETVSSLCIESSIPKPGSLQISDSADDYDSNLVNHFLWRSFLTENHLSEYQQFLWHKINLKTSDPEHQDYKKINHFLHTLDTDSVDKFYTHRNQHYQYIAGLKKTDYPHYAKEMLDKIEQFLTIPANIHSWKTYYDDFVCPELHIYTSEISVIMSEMSPFFAAYERNINAVCKIAYQWLISTEGEELLNRMKDQLGNCMNLEFCNHGELESMACFHMLTDKASHNLHPIQP